MVAGAFLFFVNVLLGDVPLCSFWQFELGVDCGFEKRVLAVLCFVEEVRNRNRPKLFELRDLPSFSP
jgi:hypothetical protein